MCFKCDSQQESEDSEGSHIVHCSLYYPKCEEMDGSSSNDGDRPIEDQESYSDNDGNESLELDDLSLYATPPITPLSNCYWSCFSSFDDLPEYLNADTREEIIHDLDVDQNYEIEGSIKKLLEYDFARSIGENDSETLLANTCVDEYGSYLAAETNLSSGSLHTITNSIHEVSPNREDGNESTVFMKNNSPFPSTELQIYESELKNEINHDKLACFKSEKSRDELDVKDATGLATITFVPNLEVDSTICMPLEQEILNDNIDDNYDDNLKDKNIYDLDVDQNLQNEGQIKQLQQCDITKSTGEITSEQEDPNYKFADNYDDKLGDDNIYDIDIDQNLQNEGHIKQLQEHDIAKSTGDIDMEQFCSIASDDKSNSHLAAEANLSSHALLLDQTSVYEVSISRDDEYQSENNLPPSSSELNILKNELSHDYFGSFDFGGTCEESDVEDVIRLEDPSLPNFETDPTIWMPPEPENLEDEIYSVTNYDDEDNYGDDTVWAQPSSLHDLNGNGKAHKYVEDRHKAMIDTMNGQFRTLVRHFLISEGISFSETADNPSWLDIVVLLSWEAAQFVKPDASEGLPMDPSSYVKVKCVASGSPHDSQVIKGLVFKKNAAHKHMLTNIKYPKLLLLQGALGHSLVGFSSFKSMDQENDHLKSITDMVDTCHPDVVMVEKTVSRDVQETLLTNKITLVFEMKLHRLERIARCLGSPIISAASFPKLMKLNQCESFRIERIVEEHNQSKGGKKSSKTLMFLEGFQKPLGCTILLKGANSDELKKIKHVLQYTVFAAYHLILETSFFADQQVFFSDKRPTGSRSKSFPDCAYSQATLDGSAAAIVEQNALHSPIPTSNGTGKPFAQEGMSLQSDLQFEAPQIIPRYDSIHSSTGNSFAHQFGNAFKSDTSDDHCITPYSAFNDNFLNYQSTGLFTLSSNNFSYEEKLSYKHNEKSVYHAECVLPASICRNQDEEGIQSVLDQQSILVLQSRRCITKQVTCEENHLSRIKYYGNSDVSLEQFLKETLLNKMYNCSSCEEPAEAHVFSYTHKNGNLSVLVRQLPQELHLLGEEEGKIWMWTRCLKCRHESGIPSTMRVLLSGSALKLSFGKFLELSFSVHSTANRLSKCGHSLLRDNLRFFGLGSKVAMFKYSPVEIYAPCKPPPVLEFHSVKGKQWLKKEIESILEKSDAFFTEVLKMMKNLSKERIQISGSFKEYCEIEGMLIKERTEFEASLLKAIGPKCQVGMTVSEFLGLRWLNQELLLQLYVWDQRIQYLLRTGIIEVKNETSHQEHINTNVDTVSIGGNLYASSARHCAQDMQIVSAEISGDADSSSHHPVLLQGLGHVDEGFSDIAKVENDMADIVRQNYSECSKIGENVGDPVSGEAFPRKESDLDFKINKVNGAIKKPDAYNASTSDLYLSVSGTKHGPVTEDRQKLCWRPFSELRKELKMDLSGGLLQKFEFINTYTPSYLSPINQPSSYPIDLLHFTVGPGATVMTASEDEISSIIAYALAFSADQQGLLGMIEKETVGIMGSIHKTSSSISDDFGLSASWSSSCSAESEGLQSISSSSSDELPTMNSDGLLSADHISSSNLHPETPIGLTKMSGKSKFSVVCIYAKEFYKLRRKCCHSELSFISSLSRCKKWDAQGGKSKAFFAKTMDDRFILKQIKKTELESFLKFGPDYFRHVSLSLESGSQTCLAKILGIYQVKQNKSGKELKLDLMVMENLMFGHNISRTYDLKGAMFSRYVTPNSEEVLLDQNFVEDMLASPIYISGKAKHLLQRALWNDTSFLTSVNVMDYSLLVGVDKQRHELVFGIIDYLREYTWDKQVETWVKASIVVPKNELPTIISPKEYKKRFRKFMSKYFLSVPCSWNLEHCPIPCKFCIDGKHSCAKIHNVELSEKPMRHANKLY